MASKLNMRLIIKPQGLICRMVCVWLLRQRANIRNISYTYLKPHRWKTCYMSINPCWLNPYKIIMLGTPKLTWSIPESIVLPSQISVCKGCKWSRRTPRSDPVTSLTRGNLVSTPEVTRSVEQEVFDKHSFGPPSCWNHLLFCFNISDNALSWITPVTPV